jgi:hypothetical protein
MAFAANTFYRLKVQAVGPRIRVFVNDADRPVLDVRDGTFDGGMMGVRDYCPDAERSLSSFSHLTVRRL